MKRNISFCIIFLMLVFSLTACTDEISDMFILGDTQRTFFLENATQRQRLERLLSITIYADGRADFDSALISSFALPPARWSIKDTELIIYSDTDSAAIAVFELADKNTLIFRESSMPLFAEAGARYVYMPQWILFDGSNITIFCQNIPYLEVFHFSGGQVHEFLVSLTYNETFAQWAGGLVLEKAEFPAGESPGDSEGTNVFLFRTSFGGRLFEYGKYSCGNYFVHINGHWYHVANPSDPFFHKVAE